MTKVFKKFELKKKKVFLEGKVVPENKIEILKLSQLDIGDVDELSEKEFKKEIIDAARKKKPRGANAFYVNLKSRYDDGFGSVGSFVSSEHSIYPILYLNISE